MLLINVQVDQLNRFYEPDRVVGMLESFGGVADRALVVNADDHNLVDLAAPAGGGGDATSSTFAVAPELLAASPNVARATVTIPRSPAGSPEPRRRRPCA